MAAVRFVFGDEKCPILYKKQAVINVARIGRNVWKEAGGRDEATVAFRLF
jgi:hypothetical protein